MSYLMSHSSAWVILLPLFHHTLQNMPRTLSALSPPASSPHRWPPVQTRAGVSSQTHAKLRLPPPPRYARTEEPHISPHCKKEQAGEAHGSASAQGGRQQAPPKDRPPARPAEPVCHELRPRPGPPSPRSQKKEAGGERTKPGATPKTKPRSPLGPLKRRS